MINQVRQFLSDSSGYLWQNIARRYPELFRMPAEPKLRTRS